MLKKIFKVLHYHFHSRKIFILIFLIFISAMLEILGIGIITLIISYLTHSNIEDFIAYKYLNLIFSYHDKSSFLKTVSFLLFCVFTIKFFYMIFLTVILSKFIATTNRLIPTKLLSIYLSKNFEWLNNQNKSHFISLAQAEVNNFCANSLFGLLFLITEILSVFAILIILIFFNYKIFLSILLILIIFVPIVYIFTKKISFKLGKQRQEVESGIMNLLNENLKAIKEFFIYKRSVFLIKNFNILKYKLAKIQAYHDSLQEGVRHILEFIGIIILLFIIFFTLSFSYYDQEKVAVLLGIYAVAFVRILPSLNRMSTYSQRLRFGSASANRILEYYEHSDNFSLIKTKEIKLTKNIKLNNIYFKFKDSNKFILNNINLEIKKNDLICIIGKSGCGKTTLTNLIMSLLQPTKGSIKVDGHDMHQQQLSIKNICFVSQSLFSLDTNILNNITLNDEKTNYKNLRFALKNSLLEEEIKKRKINLNNNIGELGSKISGGQLQRINIARALYRRPELLILDEPSSALDFENQKLFEKIINKLKKVMTIIIISHQKSLISECDNIYKIEDGTIKKLK
jgi:ABC-type bacteriocin/lantibiotic exporter with double-glycine peptidase domain